MKVLFICRNKKNNEISPIIKNQVVSLQKKGVEIIVFKFKFGGIKGYVKNIFELKRYYKHRNFDIIHAHFSFSAMASSLAGIKFVIVSLMGSDVKSSGFMKFLIYPFYKFFWSKLIVKSTDMKESLGFKHVHVIPNGVNIERFKPINKNQARLKTGWSANKFHILFAANPDVPIKNYNLAKTAYETLNISNIELHYLKDIPNNKFPYYLNSADVVLLTSQSEGSPNVIKEAMACCRPIVSTNVGDIAWLFGREPGCFLTSFVPDEVADKIANALDFAQKHGQTMGRKRILELGLDAESIASKIVSVYKAGLRQ